jgi:predicted SAM-dependent methyltransferase
MLDFGQGRLSFRRSIWSYYKVQVAYSALVRNRTAFMNRKTPGLVLDVGCGLNARPQNINLDYEWCPGVDVVCDITKGLPFEDSYVAGIFCEHCIEHIPFDAALFVFGEFRRILQPAAWVRIAVPDLGLYVDGYNAFRERGALAMPLQDDDRRTDGTYLPSMSINRIFYAHGHRFIYDFETLAASLKRAGFVDIRRRRFGESMDPRLLLDTPAREAESLYVEAQR